MKNKTCCFTGHRNIFSSEYDIIKKNLTESIIRLIKKDVIYFGSGGALGFDTMAAEAVINLKSQYPQIKLIMVYPCKNQTEFWKREDIEKYNMIKSLCDKYVYVSEEYDRFCMLKRNQHLVDCSGHCICYLKHSHGGTAYTVNYKGLEVINLYNCEKA